MKLIEELRKELRNAQKQKKTSRKWIRLCLLQRGSRNDQEGFINFKNSSTIELNIPGNYLEKRNSIFRS